MGIVLLLALGVQGGNIFGERTPPTGFKFFEDTYWPSVIPPDAKKIHGYEPKRGPSLPVYVYLTGTVMPFDTKNDDVFLQEMAKRGFLVATIEYSNLVYDVSGHNLLKNTFDALTNPDALAKDAKTSIFSKNYSTCSDIRAKANDIFATYGAGAMTKICARERADCSKGLAVHGFSQGSNIASIAKDYYSSVSAALLFGSGNRPIWHGLDDCFDQTPKRLRKKQLRVVNGELDEFFGNDDFWTDKAWHDTKMKKAVRSNVIAVSGRSCPFGVRDCLQEDGSGYYLVQPGEGPESKMINGKKVSSSVLHTFFLGDIMNFESLYNTAMGQLGRFLSGLAGAVIYNKVTLTDQFRNGDGRWAMKADFDWLAKAARENRVSKAPTGIPHTLCKCPHGIATKNDKCLIDGAAGCESCDQGYFKGLLSLACYENKCTCFFGDGAKGTACPKHGETKCAKCWDAYTLTTKKKKAVCSPKKKCFCHNGTPSQGKKCWLKGVENCATCNAGYHMVLWTWCKLNKCSCWNGHGSRGKACPENGKPHCSSCYDSHYLDGTKCKVKNGCYCNGGEPATGKACWWKGGHFCSSCYDGYHKVLGRCYKKICGCWAGTGARGSQCPRNGASKCVSCSKNYYLQNDACKWEGFKGWGGRRRAATRPKRAEKNF